jgi:hypothetical protein
MGYVSKRLGSDIEGFFTEVAFSARCDESALYIAAVGGLTLSATSGPSPILGSGPKGGCSTPESRRTAYGNT